MRIFLWRVLALVCLLEAGLAALIWLHWGFGDNGLRLGARYSARISFDLLIVVFTIGPLAALTGLRLLGEWARRGRALGLGFALAHFLHLAWLSAFLLSSGTEPSAPTVIFGGLGYALLAAMVLTSNDAARRRMGAGWKWLHRSGLYYLWFIFTYTYVGRLGRDGGFALGLAVALSALGLRLWALVKARHAKPKAG